MKNGIIAIHKPEGISSARVVARVKKSLGVKKVGHTGTLDPFATGLLLCAVNKGTRISRFFLDGHKRYLARVCLGVETDTYDLTGKTVFTASKNSMDSLNNEDIEQTVNSFIGVQGQVPPDITINHIELPNVDMEVFCSSGTYIRSLAFDIGKKLGCGAHLSKLCRTQSSAFKLEDAIRINALPKRLNSARNFQ